MALDTKEALPYKGESPRDNLAYNRYQHDVSRGKSLLQLKAVSDQMTAFIRRSWSPRSFTAVTTPEGEFDAVICNVSYHFNKHGAQHGNIRAMTLQAVRYFKEHRGEAVATQNGLLKFPNGSIYEKDGRIVTYVK
jgi:hypothetical protein